MTQCTHCRLHYTRTNPRPATRTRALHHIQEHAHARQRPLDPAVLALELRGEDLLPEARLGRVHGAHVRVLHLGLVHRDGPHEDDGHGAEQVLGLAVIQHTRLVVPAAALQREAVDEGAVAAGRVDLVGLLLRHLRHHHRLVQRPVVAARRRLHHGRQEGLRVEQPGQPHDLGHAEVRRPLHQLLHARQQVLQPRAQRAQAGVGQVAPAARHRVGCQRLHQPLHGLRHGEVALEAQVQLRQGALHLRQQHVHALALLDGDHDVGRVLVDAAADVLHVKLVRQPLHQVVQHHLGLLLHAHAALAARLTRLQLHQAVAEGLGLAQLEANLGVGVQAEGQGGLRGHLLVQELQHLAVVEGVGGRDEAGEHLQALQQLLVHVLEQVCVGQAPVPVLNDVAAVHDLAKDVAQVIPWHLDAGLQVVVGSLAAAQQVARIEGVVHVPANARGGTWQVAHTELLALQQGCMEVAEGEDDGAELSLLGAALKHLLVEQVVRTAQVGLEALWWLVGELDAVLQQGDGQPLLQGRRGLRTQEQPEVCVCALGQLVHLLLQVARRPLNGQVDVLEQHPAAVLVCVVEVVHGDGLLALAQGHRRVLASISSEAQLAAQGLHAASHIHTGRQEHEDGHTRRSILEGALQVIGLRRDVLGANHGRDEAAHGRGQAVGAQGAEQQQAVKLWHALPVTGQGLVLGAFQLHPLTPALGGADQVVRQVGVVVQLLEGLHAAPHAVRHPVRQGVVHSHDLGAAQQEVKLLVVELRLALEDGHAQLRGHDELVALKQALRHVGKHGVAGGLHQQLHAPVQLHLHAQALRLSDLGLILAARCDVHTLLEHKHKVGHRVVVHAVQGVEVVNEEVDEGAACGNGAVHLSRLGDADLSLLGQLDLLLNVNGGALGLLQVLNQLNVLQDVTLCIGQPEQQAVLQVLERDVVLVERTHQLRRLLLQVRPLVVHHQRQQLVLQALLSHTEVHEGGLGSNLGLVVRVGQLGLQVQPELGVVLHLCVSNLHDQVAPLLDGQLAYHGVQHRVNVDRQVLNQQRQAVLNAVNDLVDVLVLALLDDDQAVLLLAVHDPLDALQLGVNHERPARGVGHDGAVLNGQGISR
mmetsp:Transcript_10302/g.22116  ORF Transcript_10302/g.22116 Transcript_10302/m.22116 type:complete len:1096 (-) Transcript_10302:3570-6857(-)